MNKKLVHNYLKENDYKFGWYDLITDFEVFTINVHQNGDIFVVCSYQENDKESHKSIIIDKDKFKAWTRNNILNDIIWE